MEIIEYENIYRNEKRHFFYTSTHKLIISLIKDYSKTKKATAKILDAGCGTGLLAHKLTKFGTVWGIDTSSEAIKFSKRRGVKIKKTSVEKIPFPDKYFDIVTSVDVITHKSIENPLTPLKEFYRVLKPGGILIIRVSALKVLASSHDIHVHQKKRYNRKELAGQLKKIGFTVEKLSYMHMILFLPSFLKHFLEKINPPKHLSSVIDQTPNSINTLLIHLLSFENLLLRKCNLPIGIGLIAVARKPFS